MSISFRSARRALSLGLLCISGLVAGPVSNPVTWYYTGNAFDTGVTAPYIQGEFVSGMVTFDGPLAANVAAQSFSSSHVLSWSFTDGVQTFTSGVVGNVLGNDIVGTDANGNINAWSFYVGLANSVLTQYLPGVEGAGTVDWGLVNVPDIGPVQASVTGAPGSWSQSQAPEPGSAFLLLGGTIGCVGIAFRRRRTGNASVQRN